MTPELCDRFQTKRVYFARRRSH